MATIGLNAAAADLGRIRLKGPLAWWVWSYVSGLNSSRLITQYATERPKPTGQEPASD